MMKKTLILIVLIGFCLMAYSQDTKESSLKPTTELGVNASGVTNLLLGGDGEAQGQVPYIFTFKVIGQQGHAFRSAIGGRLDYSKNSDTERRDYDNSIDIRMGYEKQWRLSPKFVTSVGIDALYGSSLVVSESSFARTENRARNFGGGPVWGIQWMISEHLSLYTETALYYENVSSTDEVTFDGGVNADPETTIENKFKAILPASLYLAVRF